VALAAGGRDHYGWDGGRHLWAAIYDALNLNTRVSWQSKKPPPKLQPYPRPKSKPKRERDRPKVTVRDVFRRFTSRG
jgi:hypothetical protein